MMMTMLLIWTVMDNVCTIVYSIMTGPCDWATIHCYDINYNLISPDCPEQSDLVSFDMKLFPFFI